MNPSTTSAGSSTVGLVGLEPIASDHVAEDTRVPRLLVGLELQRFAHERVALERGAGGDQRPGVRFGLQGERPERQAAQQCEGLAVERRPWEGFRLVASMPLEEGPAEELLVS